nr:hypothetical protein [Cellulomonas triticagri]
MSVAVLHHLDMAAALAAWRSWVRPRGRLVVVGCYREVSAADRWVSALAVPANLLLGALLHRRATEARLGATAPTAAPEVTLADVRATVRVLLPGARVRRRLFWRYSVVWTASDTVRRVSRTPGPPRVRPPVRARRRPTGSGPRPATERGRPAPARRAPHAGARAS